MPLTTWPTASGTAYDEHHNPMTGDLESIHRYDHAIDRLLRFDPDVVDLASQLVGVERPAPMAHALVAYLHLMSTDAGDLATVADALDALCTTTHNDREGLHAEAIGAWLRGDWTGAASRLDQVLKVWPTDLLALVLGHQLDIVLGDGQSLRDRPGRVLLEIDRDHPHAAFVRGMLAFGLEESGHFGQATDAGLAAVDVNPDDVWAIHAVAHTHEMQGRVDHGIRFLTQRQADWGDGNLFTVHNWWHLALFHLECEQHDRALEIYDTEIHHDGSDGVPLELLDASALLWRFLLDGVGTGGRFTPLADSWSAHTMKQPWYVFNDLHATMALAGAGRLGEAHELIHELDGWLDTASGTNARMTAEIGLPACRAVVAFVEDRHADVIAELGPIRRVLQHFGGSHAQRDALQRTLLESSLRAGRYELARALTAERLVVRETSVYGWSQRARALRGLGDVGRATAADAAAARHRARFAKAGSRAVVTRS